MLGIPAIEVRPLGQEPNYPFVDGRNVVRVARPVELVSALEAAFAVSEDDRAELIEYARSWGWPVGSESVGRLASLLRDPSRIDSKQVALDTWNGFWTS